MHKNKWRYKKTIFWLRFTGIIIAFIVVIVGIDKYVRPTINQYTKSIAEMRATAIMNTAIEKCLQDANVTYKDLAIVTRNNNQEVVSVETNMVQINQLRTKIIRQIAEDIHSSELLDVNIPAGTLTGNSFLSGRGPYIHFKILPSTFISSRFSNKFESTGINQSVHKIILDLSVVVYADIPFYRTSVDVKVDFPITETVIVGQVPETFLSLGDIGGTVVSKLANS